MGELDEDTVFMMRDAIGGMQLRCLRWIGYAAETPHTNSPTRYMGRTTSRQISARTICAPVGGFRSSPGMWMAVSPGVAACIQIP